jgi:adenosylcobinamide kinase/adenosylcobinamide-phosphate guanylyltransferase
MSDVTFVLGGCKSGKSGHALALAESLAADRHIYVATCVPGDQEMHDRVRRHRQERGSRWETKEEPLQIARTIERLGLPQNVLLVDCLTLWITNLLLERDDVPLNAIESAAEDLCRTLVHATGPVLLVSNEVGTGIVPQNRLSRLFRDAAGLANQKVAAVADRVIWMVAGIPVQIK